MSLQELSREIQSDAQAQNEQINQETLERIKTLETEFETNFNSHKTKVLEKHNSEIDLLKTKLESKYSKLCKEQELDAKTQIINQVKQNCLTEVLNLSSAQKEALYKKLFKLAKSMIKLEVVYVNKTDKKFINSLIGDKTEIKTDNNLVGLIFETYDGLERLDLNFTNLFESIFQDSEAQIQQILFN